MKCKKCNSDKIYKYGIRKNWLHGVAYYRQAYQCRQCGHQWQEGNKMYVKTI
jgi:hypothetical protein